MMEDIRQKGFTLIELMVAMAISGMLMAVVAMAYTGQSRSNTTVQDVSSLQQDMRSALQLMAREIRMAGYNPTGISGVGISNATSTDLQFTSNYNNDADVHDLNEDIRYAINGSGALGREIRGQTSPYNAGGLQPIAENIDKLTYEYLLDDDSWTQAPADLTKIRAVKIMLLGHSARETAGAVDSSTFTPPLASATVDWTPVTPGRYHWRLMSLIVQCRNLQIKS